MENLCKMFPAPARFNYVKNYDIKVSNLHIKPPLDPTFAFPTVIWNFENLQLAGLYSYGFLSHMRWKPYV